MSSPSSKQNDRALPILDAYATHLGIRRHAASNGPLWTGRTLQTLGRAEDVAHEIAHWFLATPDRRSLQNFGWGSDYQYEKDSTPYENHHEEIQACVLGFALLIRCGYDPTQHWADYCFTDWSHDECRERLNDHAGVIRTRREVQCHVEEFVSWRNQTSHIS